MRWCARGAVITEWLYEWIESTSQSFKVQSTTQIHIGKPVLQKPHAFFFSSQDALGVSRYDGHHTKGEEEGKWVTYSGYAYNFSGIPLENLRISPNAMDALMACQQAFS